VELTRGVSFQDVKAAITMITYISGGTRTDRALDYVAKNSFTTATGTCYNTNQAFTKNNIKL